MQPEASAPATEGLTTASRMPGGSTASTARETPQDATASAAKTPFTSRGQDWAVHHVAATLLVRSSLIQTVRCFCAAINVAISL